MTITNIKLSMNTKDKKVLIIDDDGKNIFALTAVLKAYRYSCVSAYSAADGLNLLAVIPDIGIVLMDMMMPEMDGYTAIPKIRQNKNFGQIPVIAVTAQAMPGDKERCLDAGADDYISKPVDVDKLLAILKAHLK